MILWEKNKNGLRPVMYAQMRHKLVMPPVWHSLSAMPTKAAPMCVLMKLRSRHPHRQPQRPALHSQTLHHHHHQQQRMLHSQRPHPQTAKLSTLKRNRWGSYSRCPIKVIRNLAVRHVA